MHIGHRAGRPGLRFLVTAVVVLALAALASEAVGSTPQTPAGRPPASSPLARHIPDGSPVVALAAAATPAPVAITAASAPAMRAAAPPALPAPAPSDTPAPAPVPAASALATPHCGAYPVILSPAPDLVTATTAAAGFWNDWAGCQKFTIGQGGMRVWYATDWPGQCTSADAVACTDISINIDPTYGRSYDAASVIAHELGHVLNYGHHSGVPVMDPGLWSGPGTVWCSLFTRCR